MNASIKFAVGKEIRIGGEAYRVIANAIPGRRSIVYQVDNGRGRRLALKIAVDRKPETLSSIANEEEKTRAYARHGFNHAEIVTAGPDYVVKRWVDGIRGDRWTRAWAKDGFPPDSPQLIRLGELLRRSAEKKIYLRDFNQNNLIWDGSDWVIIDTGSIKKRLSSSRILRLYREYIAENWGRSTTPNCGDVFRRLLPRKIC